MGHYTMYQDQQRQWRWRYTASNGKIISVSSEAYWHKSDCEHSIAIMKSSSSAPVYG